MGYMKIQNLYKDRTILLFREFYALEKIHGTSANIQFVRDQSFDGGSSIKFHSGGEKHENFVAIFDQQSLKEKFMATGMKEIRIYGEAYGGRCQGMSQTYGKDLKFVAFDVLHYRGGGDQWLGIEQANRIVQSLGLEFVAWNKVSTDLDALDAERDLPSRQALRDGITEPKISEGVVLRPLIELSMPDGSRIIAKHKNPKFSERASKRDTNASLEGQEAIEDANKIASEWVTEMRLSHVVDKMEASLSRKLEIDDTKQVIVWMVADIYNEGKWEIVESKNAKRSIGRETAEMFKEYIQNRFSSE